MDNAFSWNQLLGTHNLHTITHTHVQKATGFIYWIAQGWGAPSPPSFLLPASVNPLPTHPPWTHFFCIMLACIFYYFIFKESHTMCSLMSRFFQNLCEIHLTRVKNLVLLLLVSQGMDTTRSGCLVTWGRTFGSLPVFRNYKQSCCKHLMTSLV